MPLSSEAELIAQVLSGDQNAFRALFRQHSPTMFGVALRMLAGNRADAEDAVQEAWLRGVRGLGSFRGDSSLRTWLVGITVRCALEICRRRERDGRGEPFDAVLAAPGDRIDLERALALLAAGYRHVLVLHDIYGYTHAEIGHLLGIDEGTSKSQLSRARHIVRRALAETPPAQESRT